MLGRLIEWSVRNVFLVLVMGIAIVAGLHPGTVDTRLSMPFQRGLAAGQLQRAEQSADHLLQVIERLTAEDSGGFFAWDGQPIVY